MEDIKFTQDQESKRIKKREDMGQFARYLGIDYDDFLNLSDENSIDFDDYSS